MRSYIKIYAPPFLKAIRALEKVAIDIPTVCIMNTTIEAAMSLSDYYPMKYFSQFGAVPPERCDKIVSKSGVRVGKYDFYFEWFNEPTYEDLTSLLEKIDEALAPLGCRYTITNKKR